jgi:hypothetical protein
MAGYTTAAENTAVTAVSTAATWISLHTADPGTVANNELLGGSYARKQVTWGTVGTPTPGSVTASAPAVINVPAATTITHWALHTASTGTSGQYYSGTLPASETFGAAGTYSLTPTLSATN